MYNFNCNLFHMILKPFDLIYYIIVLISSCTYHRWVVRFHTIFFSFRVNLSMTPLQLSTNWLFKVSFTERTTPEDSTSKNNSTLTPTKILILLVSDNYFPAYLYYNERIIIIIRIIAGLSKCNTRLMSEAIPSITA